MTFSSTLSSHFHYKPVAKKHTKTRKHSRDCQKDNVGKKILMYSNDILKELVGTRIKTLCRALNEWIWMFLQNNDPCFVNKHNKRHQTQQASTSALGSDPHSGLKLWRLTGWGSGRESSKAVLRKSGDFVIFQYTKIRHGSRITEMWKSGYTFNGPSNWEENTDCFATPKWISFNMMQLQRGTNCTRHLVLTVGRRSDNGQGDSRNTECSTGSFHPVRVCWVFGFVTFGLLKTQASYLLTGAGSITARPSVIGCTLPCRRQANQLTVHQEAQKKGN